MSDPLSLGPFFRLSICVHKTLSLGHDNSNSFSFIVQLSNFVQNYFTTKKRSICDHIILYVCNSVNVLVCSISTFTLSKGDNSIWILYVIYICIQYKVIINIYFVSAILSFTLKNAMCNMHSNLNATFLI